MSYNLFQQTGGKTCNLCNSFYEVSQDHQYHNQTKTVQKRKLQVNIIPHENKHKNFKQNISKENLATYKRTTQYNQANLPQGYKTLSIFNDQSMQPTALTD